MKPADTTRSGRWLDDGVGEGPVPLLAGGVVAHPSYEGRDAGPFGARQPLDPVAVGTDGDHLGAVAGVGAGVEQGLEVGAGAGDQDDEAHARSLGGARRGPGAATRS